MRAYSKMSLWQLTPESSFQQQSLKQDELEAAYLHSPTRANQLDSLEQMELCRINLDSLIHQLDLETSLSLTWFGSTRCRHLLQPDSFDRSSFEHRALPCAALLDTTRISTQLHNKQVQSFQLPMQQLCFGLVQGGVQHRAFHQPALQTRAFSTALALISLSFALDAWLKTSSKRAWKRNPLRKNLCTTSLSTRSSQTALATSSTTTATSSLRRTLLSVLWFSFLFSNFFLSSSFWKTEVDKHNELSQTVWEQEPEELQVDEYFPLDPFHDHLGKENLWSDQLQEEQVPDRELRQLHLQQLHQQDQPFKGTKQLPKEHSFTSCLLRQMISSFSKKKLERLHLTRSSLEQNLSQVQLLYYKFFAENFGQQLSEKQLQQNLSTDQQQLQEHQLTQNNFQQLSLEQPSFTEKILHNELATIFDKKSFAENLSFRNFYFTNLAFPDNSFRRVSREELLQEAACTKQLHPERRRSLQRTASSNWLCSRQ